MNPPDPAPPFTATSDITHAEQALLQAARAMQQPEPAPALDAAILNAAAQRAAEVRFQAQTDAATEVPTKTLYCRYQQVSPKTWPALERFSRWLFGDGEVRGHLRQALATCLVAGIALGFVLHVNRENALAPALSGDVVAMRPAPPEAAPSLAAPEEMLEPAPVLAEENAAEMAEDRAADKKYLAALESKSAERQSAIPGSLSNVPSPSPSAEAARTFPAREMDAEARSRITEKSEARKWSIPASSQEASGLPQKPVPAPATAPMSAARERSIEMEPAPTAPEIPAPPPAAPSMRGGITSSEAEKADSNKKISIPEQDKRDSKKTPEADIDTQLRRILALHRAGREKEAEHLLKQLRVEHPNRNIDERLRQLKSRENRERK